MRGAEVNDAPAASGRTEFLAAVGRTEGEARLRVVGDGARSLLSDLYQRQPLRILLPRPDVGEPLTAVLTNLSGGIVGGDRLSTRIELGERARLLVAAQAAEKVYRSAGPTAESRVAFDVAAGAVLEWLPQGAIVFDGAEYRQSVEIDVAAGATALVGNISILGRAAMGESFRRGRYREHWTLRREGKPVWLDRFDLRDPLGAAAAPSAMAGIRAFASAILVADGAARDLEWAREAQEVAARGMRAGATALTPDVLLLRWFAEDAGELRAAVGAFWGEARRRWLGHPERLPVLWRI